MTVAVLVVALIDGSTRDGSGSTGEGGPPADPAVFLGPLAEAIDAGRGVARGMGIGAGSRCPLAEPSAKLSMSMPGCQVLFSDTAADSAPESLWGELDCEEESRHSNPPVGGDPRARADGGPQLNRGFRRLAVLDGDDVFGERCELGENDHRTGPTALYREGDRLATFLSLRLPGELPLGGEVFQVVMQMKQTQPASNGGGTPALALEAFDGEWKLRRSDSPGPSEDAHELWSAPAQVGSWTRFALDVTYSQNDSVGAITWYVDRNGDGDFTDPGERSPTIRTYTLKTETSGGDDDGIEPTEPIPSHLRVGLYHGPDYVCPPPSGCFIDVDNVQILGP